MMQNLRNDTEKGFSFRSGRGMRQGGSLMLKLVLIWVCNNCVWKSAVRLGFWELFSSFVKFTFEIDFFCLLNNCILDHHLKKHCLNFKEWNWACGHTIGHLLICLMCISLWLTCSSSKDKYVHIKYGAKSKFFIFMK